MGEVWQAVDEVLGRTVAVKLLLNRGADDEAITRFHLEARTAARLSNPHVVTVYDVGTDGDRQFLVTEFLEGNSLAAKLSEHGPVCPVRAAQIGSETADGLAAAHREGVVHRDVKPANLLMTADGGVKVADFGIARFMNDSIAGPTKTGLLIGTSAYLSPERALGHTADSAADIYSLGCVLYELLVGHPPFRADTALGMLYQHVGKDPAPLSHFRSDLSPQLDDFIMRMLAKDPERRPVAELASDFLAAMDRSAGDQPAHRDIPRHQAVIATPPEDRTETAPPAARKPLRVLGRRSQVISGIAAAAVAAATVIMLSGTSPGGGEKKTPPTSVSAPPTHSVEPTRATRERAPDPAEVDTRTPPPSVELSPSSSATTGKKASPSGDRSRAAGNVTPPAMAGPSLATKKPVPSTTLPSTGTAAPGSLTPSPSETGTPPQSKPTKNSKPTKGPKGTKTPVADTTQ
jgi:serine/threonine-protein kinase